MSVPFIPPPGTLQFVMNKFPTRPFWVYPTLEKYGVNLHCACTSGYRVVPGSDSAVGLSDDCPAGFSSSVCGCQGRIIE